jgi:hypothetical protein
MATYAPTMPYLATAPHLWRDLPVEFCLAETCLCKGNGVDRG